MKLFEPLRHYRDDSEDLPLQRKDDHLRRYLLGDLRAKQRHIIERKYFADNDEFEYLSAIEDELIDQYLKGELSARDQRRFDTHFLATPMRRERVESARALMEVVAHSALKPRRNGSRESRWKAFTWAFACSTLLLVIGFTSLISKDANLQKQLARANVELKTRAHEMLGPAASGPEPLVLSFVLGPVQRDGVNVNRLVIPSEAQAINFSVELPASTESEYRAIFRTPDGDQIAASTDVTTHASQAGMSATVKAPSAVFTPGTYILTIQRARRDERFGDVKSYSFTVVRR